MPADETGQCAQDPDAPDAVLTLQGHFRRSCGWIFEIIGDTPFAPIALTIGNKHAALAIFRTLVDNLPFEYEECLAELPDEERSVPKWIPKD